jgi:molecular chaperone DnaJ
MVETYYDVLGVSPDAGQGAIDAAYRERVKETHPDLNDAADASEQFQTVKTAHEVLGDADERARYDRLGHGSYVRFVGGGPSPENEDGPGAGDAGSAGGRTRDRSRSQTSANRRGRAGAGGSSGDRSGSDGARTDGWYSDPYASEQTSDGRRTYDFTEDVWEERDGFDFGGSTDTGGSTGGASTESTTREDPTESFTREEEEAYRETRERAREARNGGNSGRQTGQTDGGYAVHDWQDDAVDRPPIRLNLTQDHAVVASIVFVLYPVFLFSAVTPMFSTLTNVVVGVCTLLTMGYLMTLPELGLLVFGAWSVLAPIVVLTVAPWPAVSVLTMLVLGVTWIPFGYSLMVASVTR